ncbi:hypothetical protein Pyn_34790 [Prunus yedoensis var. nudiflora]|uniref:Uncharacterized protein n=1 Tax=Prunus yedoensis var. nudiflora TaxID=2094558 RepID=A0A314XJB4_PRUYE|nr:hypothetical protein Pyn_34790 [Prunus yedoensis var. nudiflora]
MDTLIIVAGIGAAIGDFFNKKHTTEQQKLMSASVYKLTTITKELETTTLELKESTKMLQIKMDAIQAPSRLHGLCLSSDKLT